MKYDKKIAKLISRLKEKQVPQVEKEEATPEDELVGDNCPICGCNCQEHESYVYCEILKSYICDICCRYEVCNDYKLVNQALDKEIFNNNQELIMLCEYCQ